MIIRVERRERYTVLSNVPLTDIRLSWKARGLLAFLLSKPDGWRATIRGLVNQAPDGRDRVMSGLKELETCGYLTRTRRRKSDGSFAWESVVREEPCSGFPDTGKPSTGDPHTENPDVEVVPEDLGTEENPLAPQALEGDELAAAVIAAIDGGPPTTRRAQDALAVAAAELRHAGATPREVKARAAAYRARWTTAVLTPMALVKHWSTFSNAAHPATPPPVDRSCPLDLCGGSGWVYRDDDNSTAYPCPHKETPHV